MEWTWVDTLLLIGAIAYLSHYFSDSERERRARDRWRK